MEKNERKGDGCCLFLEELDNRLLDQQTLKTGIPFLMFKGLKELGFTLELLLKQLDRSVHRGQCNNICVELLLQLFQKGEYWSRLEHRF